MKYTLIYASIALVMVQAQAQTITTQDSLISLNKDISLLFYQSLVIRTQYSLDLSIAFQTQDGILITDFYLNKKKLRREKEQVIEDFHDVPSDPRRRYFRLRGLRNTHTLWEVKQPQFMPDEQIKVRYIKKGKAFYALIPLEQLRTSYRKP